MPPLLHGIQFCYVYTGTVPYLKRLLSNMTNALSSIRPPPPPPTMTTHPSSFPPQSRTHDRKSFPTMFILKKLTRHKLHSTVWTPNQSLASVMVPLSTPLQTRLLFLNPTTVKKNCALDWTGVSVLQTASNGRSCTAMSTDMRFVSVERSTTLPPTRFHGRGIAPRSKTLCPSPMQPFRSGH